MTTRTNGRAKARRLVVVSNRLPVTLKQGTQGWETQPSIGGLVSALAPVLRRRGGMWIGWSGVTGKQSIQGALDKGAEAAGYELHPVELTQDEHERYYYGFSNEILWPLFHDLETLCNFDPTYQEAYEQVNAKFAAVLAEHATAEDYVWVQDYHLFQVGREARRRGLKSPMGFFLHIPFPPLDVYAKLPWRHELLEALFEYDLVGFQSLRDRRNFLQCLRGLIKGIEVDGKGPLVTVRAGERTVRVGVFPIGIEWEETLQEANAPEVDVRVAEIRQALPGQRIIVGVDRLDYTKGIPERLRAFRLLLERHPALRGRITFFQVVAPSRSELPEYEDLRDTIDRLVGQINGAFSQPGWVPIRYFSSRVSRTELLAFYRVADVALVTPLKDGMNLVAKEYAACRLGEDGVLVLSEFAGAAPQMQRGALLVNPTDYERAAEAVFEALNMAPDEQKRRMRILRRSVQRNDITWWVDSFLRAAFPQAGDDLPFVEDYAPRLRIRGATPKA